MLIHHMSSTCNSRFVSSGARVSASFKRITSFGRCTDWACEANGQSCISHVLRARHNRPPEYQDRLSSILLTLCPI